MPGDIRQSTTGSMNSVSNYSVSNKSSDATYNADENVYYNQNFNKWYGYYRTIPELHSAINTFATYIVGRGYNVLSSQTETMLEHIRGFGEDTFTSIMWNLLITKKFNGDAYAEIIKDKETGILLNLKPLDPSKMRTIYNKKGKIIRYEQTGIAGEEPTKFKPSEILHVMNDRVIDEPHGQSIIEAVQWCIDAKNEAMADWRRISHRSTVRILFVEETDTTRLANLKTSYPDAISKGDLLILPVKPGDASFQDLTLPPAEQFLAWIRYLENFFYQALGIPKVVMGGTADNTEASAKISVVVFDPIFTREVTELEADIWNQLKIRIKFNKQPSLMDNAQTDETKNASQTGFQANDVTAGSGK